MFNSHIAYIVNLVLMGVHTPGIYFVIIYH